MGEEPPEHLDKNPFTVHGFIKANVSQSWGWHPPPTQKVEQDKNPPSVNRFIKDNIVQSWGWERPVDEVQIDGLRPVREDTTSKIIVRHVKKTTDALVDVLGESMEEAERMLTNATNSAMGTEGVEKLDCILITTEEDDLPVQGPGKKD